MQKQTNSHDAFVTVLTELIGISVLAIIADTSDTAGSIAVALMAGWLLIFLISNTQFLSSVTSKL